MNIFRRPAAKAAANPSRPPRESGNRGASFDARGDSPARPFWRTKKLEEMFADEWESLCDGCGKCCLHKIENTDGTLNFTRVACPMLNLPECRCSDYPNRARKMHDCVTLTPTNIPHIDWLPSTCAYRLVHEGRDLPWWHPLVSGDPETVHTAGISVRDRAIPERRAGNIERHVVDWAS